MNDQAFARRLAQELPHWQQAGWVTEQGGAAMLADLAARRGRLVWASTLALVGALLLGVGVITWFAAHWGEMGKLLKLLLVVSALSASHIAHGLCLSRSAMPRLAQGMALLSVLFFGAAIMLIGQMYHIDAHFPDGIALWAAGGLLTAWLLASQPALVASLLLAALWTWNEQFDYKVLNGPLLGYLLLAGVLLWRKRWPFAARLWGGLFVLWLIGWHALPWIGPLSDSLAHVRLLALQVLGLAGAWALAQGSGHPLARAVRGDFLLVALLGIFAFTFPDLAWRHTPPVQGHGVWLAAWAAVALIYAAGIVRLVRASALPVQRLGVGIALAAGLAALLALEIAMPRSSGLQALVWNGLFLGLMYGLGDLGMREGDRQMVNRAFTGLALLVLARYFDTFWSLMDRALFFMAGGVLLLAGGGWLERRRRALLTGMDARRSA